MNDKFSDSDLMKLIYTRWHDLIESTTRPANDAAFVAALIANESGGDDRASRFERSVYVKFDKIKCGVEQACAGFTAEILKKMNEAAISALATSYGLTQIMGYHIGPYRAPAILLNPTRNLCTANKLITDFSSQFHLDPKKDFESLFRCWNTGTPSGATSDPGYVLKGLSRIDAYREIMAATQEEMDAAEMEAQP